jgi:two-component sensor histidine kinase
MRKIFPFDRADEKIKIDFSLIPLGIVLLEFSILSTELALETYSNIYEIFLIRVIHASFLFLCSYLFTRLAIRRGKLEFSFRELAIPGAVIAILGVFGTNVIAHSLHVAPISIYRSIASSLLQGLFWFPFFLLGGSRRSEIFTQFKEYEKRLIISTRALSRTSQEFQISQRQNHERIRNNLKNICSSLRESINAVDTQELSVADANKAIQIELKGEGLRRLSMELETFGSERENTSFLGQNTKFLKLLITQFKILYSDTAQKAPLNSSAYALILIVLITPAHINYFTTGEAAISYPLLSLAIIGFSKLITMAQKSKSSHRVRNASLLIYLTGLLPLLFNLVGQSITHDPNTQFPIYIGAFTLPFGYFVIMRVLQVLQPRAIDLVRNDELRASEALKSAVTEIVSDEFSHTLSHRWAIYIHGKILTRLAATALKLETASNLGDTETFTSSLRSLVDLLDNPDRDFEQKADVLESEVASRLDPWLGLLEVELHIDQDLKLIRNDKVRELGEVIEEIISNSMRHGKAQKIKLRVTRMGENDIQINAVDDATLAPPEIQLRYGLGTRIFNLASDGRWSITRVDSRTEFQLTMAMDF